MKLAGTAARQAKTVSGRATRIMNAPTSTAQDQHLGIRSSSSLLTNSPSVRNITICMSHVKPSKKTVSERFCCQLVVADDQPREVDGQVAVALDQVGEGEGEEDEGQQQHRVERVVGEVDAG